MGVTPQTDAVPAHLRVTELNKEFGLTLIEHRDPVRYLLSPTLATYHEDDHENKANPHHDSERQQIQVSIEWNTAVNAHSPPAK